MNGSAGADALDDLLPEIAALAEVECAGLGRFLGKMALLDIDAVQRSSSRGCAGLRVAATPHGVAPAAMSAAQISGKDAVGSQSSKRWTTGTVRVDQCHCRPR